MVEPTYLKKIWSSNFKLIISLRLEVKIQKIFELPPPRYRLRFLELPNVCFDPPKQTCLFAKGWFSTNLQTCPGIPTVHLYHLLVHPFFILSKVWIGLPVSNCYVSRELFLLDATHLQTNSRTHPTWGEVIGLRSHPGKDGKLLRVVSQDTEIQQFLTPAKINIVPQKVTFPKGKMSSNHPFSGAMSFFWGSVLPIFLPNQHVLKNVECYLQIYLFGDQKLCSITQNQNSLKVQSKARQPTHLANSILKYRGFSSKFANTSVMAI